MVLSPFAVFGTDENAEAWIYYLFLIVPILVVGCRRVETAHGRGGRRV